MSSLLTAVVPTLGRSPLLPVCLQALRDDGGEELEIIVVDQGTAPVELPAGLADRVLRPGKNLGFAGGTNLGIAAASNDLICTVNDDAEVERGWTRTLVTALANEPEAACAQGVNLRFDDPGLADGMGLAWNADWQAVQLGHGSPAPAGSSPPCEVFGVSATAALFRRRALLEIALPGGEIFDARLGSYYEDVDLACRLRAAGWRALVVPAARARHAGSVTGRTMETERWRRIYGNRYLVLARFLGGGFWTRLPGVAMRDLKDLARALGSGDGSAAAGIAGGWARALRWLPAFARCGPPALELSGIERFRITSAE